MQEEEEKKETNVRQRRTIIYQKNIYVGSCNDEIEKVNVNCMRTGTKYHEMDTKQPLQR